MPTEQQPGSDLRALVLLLLAVLIVAASWHRPALDKAASSYAVLADKVLRSKEGRIDKGVQLAAGLACAETPPELAAFFNLPLPVNRADQAALIRLPGIGPKLAESIIRYREEQGGIAGPADLLKVKGIGPKRSARLLPFICFDTAP